MIKMIEGGTILFNGGNDYMKNDTIEKGVLKELYDYLTDDHNLFLIMFNTLYFYKNNIKNIKLSSDYKILSITVEVVNEFDMNIVEKEYIFHEDDFYIKKKKIKNYIKLKEDLTMLYYFKYLKRENKDNIMNIEFLKKIMNERNISIYRLSKLTKLRDSGLGMIINGKREDPKISTIVKIAKALELSEHEFAILCGYVDGEND